MAFASAVLMLFSDSAAKWELVLVFGTVIGAVALRRGYGTSAEVARESMTIMTVVLLLFAFVIVAAVVLLLWAAEPGLGG